MSGKEQDLCVSAPGKIFIAGEWSVLEGEPAILSAVDARVFVRIRAVTQGLENFNVAAEASPLVAAALMVVKRLLGGLRPCRLEISPLLFDFLGAPAGKIGLGSSSATVAACVAALITFFNNGKVGEGEKELVYRLSALAHFIAQGNRGSLADVAASVYGGNILYTPPEVKWLCENINHNNWHELFYSRWPGFSVCHFPWPKELKLLIGWSGKNSSTTNLIQQMHSWAGKNCLTKTSIYREMGCVTRTLFSNLTSCTPCLALPNIEMYQSLLLHLAGEAQLPLCTPRLERLCSCAKEAGGAAKLSGAGGGDCGIALVFDDTAASRLCELWYESGITPLNLRHGAAGVEC